MAKRTPKDNKTHIERINPKPVKPAPKVIRKPVKTKPATDR